MQFKRLIFDNDRVPSVNTTLVTDYDIRRFTEQIRNLSFPFVAPLGTNYNYVSQGFLKSARVFNKLPLSSVNAARVNGKLSQVIGANRNLVNGA